MPVADVVRVEVVGDVLAAVRGLRAPGTGVLGRVALGTYCGRGWRDLVLAVGRGPGVVLTLREGAAWRRLLCA